MPEGLATTHDHASHPALRHHFENMEQQREAGTLGMWVFLVTEIMFFGGMFLAYTLYRAQYPAAFVSASNNLDIRLGAINTAVLIVSSFTMAMAVWSTQVGRQRTTIICLILTMILGATFLGIKAVEYHDKYNDHLIPGRLIPSRPFGPEVAKRGETDPHQLHMIIGLGIMTVILIMAWRGKFSPEYHAPVEISGLYWHFVDIIWIFLFPLLYLLGRHLEHHREL